MVKTVCKLNMCTGCMACIEKCPVGAIKISDTLSEYNAEIDLNTCINCGLCEKVCPNVAKTFFIQPRVWYQGWSNNEKIRNNSASGGIATALMNYFVDNIGYVCGCYYNKGNFEFKIAKNREEIKLFSGSKYVKSNAQMIYKDIKIELNKNNKILFVGLPCQVAGVKNYIGERLLKNLYTIDLICHGTPSPALLNKYLKEHKIEMADLYNIKFRSKYNDNVKNSYDSIVGDGLTDKYLYSFLKSINYTENCYSCNYAKTERCSDITLGDSWGSDLPITEINRGISLILCQTDKGIELLKKSDVYITDVDKYKAIDNNKQLSRPSFKRKERDIFFKNIKNNKSYDSAVYRCYPKVFIKQDIKKILLKFKIIKPKASKTEFKIFYVKK